MGAQVTGIDLSEKALGVARLHLYESGHAIDYRLIAAEAMADEAPGGFDVVTCLEMLEHVPDPASSVAACARLVKPGGRCSSRRSTAMPRPTCWRSSARNICSICCRAAPTTTAASSSRPNSPACAAMPVWKYSKIIGLRYNPLTREGMLGGDTDVNYLLRARRSA